MTGNSLVIGLDYGTTFTGVSYCELSSSSHIEPRIQVVQNWTGASSVISTREKTPSEIAYCGDTIYWGNEIPPHVKRHRWTKLELDGRRSGEAGMIQDELTPSAYGVVGGAGYGGLGGVKRPVDIIADYLAEVKKKLFSNLDDQYGKQLWRTLSITLVVTVPAVWSDLAKSLTMQAVEKAGFNTTELPLLKRTITATEPEAAAIYTIQSLKGSVRNEQLAIGDGFVVCDMGGGTVDLISYRVAGISPTIIEEATTGSGDQCGSIFVDRAFLAWLEKKVGVKDFLKVAGCRVADLPRTSIPSPLARIAREFSLTAKIGFRGTQDYYLGLPGPLISIHDEDRGMCYGEIRITAEEMKKMFEFPLHRTQELLKQQLQEARQKSKANVKYVFLVGGFAESDYMHKELSALVEANNAQVIRPDYALSAIVRGATAKGLEAHGQSPVKSRKCRRHYGRPTSQPFNKKKHREAEAHLCTYTGRKRARSNASWLIAKGQDLPTAATVHGKLNMTSHFWVGESRKSTLRLIASDEDQAALRSNEPGVYEVAKLSVDLSSVPERCFRKRRGKSGKTYYDLEYEVEISVQSTLEYHLVADGVRYGTITAEYA